MMLNVFSHIVLFGKNKNHFKRSFRNDVVLKNQGKNLETQQLNQFAIELLMIVISCIIVLTFNCSCIIVDSFNQFNI